MVLRRVVLMVLVWVGLLCGRVQVVEMRLQVCVLLLIRIRSLRWTCLVRVRVRWMLVLIVVQWGPFMAQPVITDVSVVFRVFMSVVVLLFLGMGLCVVRCLVKLMVVSAARLAESALESTQS